MDFARQTWTLTLKNLLIVFVRHWFATTFRALVLPCVFMFFISYAKNFFVPPSVFGIGTASPILGLTEGLNEASGGRDKVVFVNNGYTNGSINAVIDQLSTTVRDAGKIVRVLPDNSTLPVECPSSLRGASQCYGAAEFIASPSEGSGGMWSYKIRADGALGGKIYVNRDSNDAQVFILPLQHEIDRVIASVGGTTPMPETVYNYPFTMRNQAERAANIVQLYQGTLIDVIAVAFFIGMVGVTYHLVGHVAMERELGMSQLIEAMMPNKRRWAPQVARLLAAHVSFDIMYLPGWIINGLIVAYLVFPDTDVGIIVGLHILGGLALSSWSLLFASFFRRAQLSGITTTIASLVLAIIAQIPLGKHGSTGAVVILSLLFTPMNYTFFLLYVAGFQQQGVPTKMTQATPADEIKWSVSGAAFFVLFAIQIIVFPVLALLVERSLYGTASRERRMHHTATPDKAAVRLQGFSKYYGSSKFKQLMCFGRGKYKDVFKAVDNLNLEILQGQIMVLLGANGSGKSTTLDAIAGLHEISAGSIDIDGRGGLGLCPQKNVLWDELTVYEHVWVFDRLKSPRDPTSGQERKNLIAQCDLAIKTPAQSKTLSGGQKRKLQLAMMFCGGSKVCCVDEVSSGIDPLARRKVWDILLSERGRRTILLTTHFLDEADVLSDHIAILSKGILKADGTAVELKSRLGGGYQLSVSSHATFTLPAELQHVRKRVDYDQTLYALDGSSEVSSFIAELDRQNVVEYRIQGPTVESVFLRLADEIRDDLGMRAPSDTELVKKSTEDAKISDVSSEEVAAEAFKKGGSLDLHTGQGTSLARQSWILFRKRFTVLRRNFWPYAAAVLIPIIAAGLVTLFLSNFTLPTCAPGAQISEEQVSDFTNAITIDAPYGPPSAVPTQALTARYSALNASSLHPVNSLDAMNQYVTTNYHNVTPGGFWIGDRPTFAYLSDYELESPVLVQSLFDQLLIQTPLTTQFQPFSTPFVSQAGDSLQLILYFGLAMSAYPGFFALYPTAERLRKVRALHYSNGVRSLPIWTAYVLFDFLFVLLVSVLAIAIFVGVWDGWYQPGYMFVVFFLYGLTSAAYSHVVSLFTSSQLAAFAFSAGSQAVLFLIYLISYFAIITYSPVNQIDSNISTAHFAISIVTPAGSMLRSLLLSLNEFSILCRGFNIASYPGEVKVYGGPILYLIVQFIILFTFLVWYDSGGRFTTLFFRRGRKQHHDNDVLAEAEATNAFNDKSLRQELSNAASNGAGLRVLHLSKSFGHVNAVDDISFAIAPSTVFALLGPNGAGKSTTISLIRGDLRPSNSRSEVNIQGVNLFSDRVKARNNLGVCPQFDAIDSMTVSEHLLFYARARGVKDANHNVHVVMHAVGLHPYANRLAAKLSGGNKRKLSLAIALMGNPAVLLLDEPSSGMDAAAKRVMWRVLGSVSNGRALLITTHSMEEADALADRAGIVASRMLALGSTERLRKDWGDALNVHLVHEESPHTSTEEMERIRRWILDHVPGAHVEERTWSGQLRFSVSNQPSASSSDHGKLTPTPSDDKAVTKESEMVDSENFHDAKSTRSVDIEKSSANEPTSPLSSTAQGSGMTISALFKLLEENKDTLRFAQYSVSPTTLDQVFLNVVTKHNVEEEGGEKASARRGNMFKRLMRR